MTPRRTCLLFAFMTIMASFGMLSARGEADWSSPMLRYPSPSPDGSMIAFSYGGDIWIAEADGNTLARRITVHEAYDYRPVWSPDGSRIAFASDRTGDNNVYVVDTVSLKPVQLTIHERPDAPVDWTPDGAEVIFVSARDLSPRRIPTPYRVKADRSTRPAKLWPVMSMDVRLSPAGRTVAFVRGYERWWRKGYKGSNNYDIWLYDLDSGEYKQITKSTNPEYNPMWAADGKSIYYLAEESMTANIYRMAADGSNVVKLTDFAEDGARWARISEDGGTIAFERGCGIYLLNTASGAISRFSPRLPADNHENNIERLTLSRSADDFAVNADNSQAAVTVRGELVALENAEDGYNNPLSNTPARESDPAWLPDSTSLLYVSDKAGNRDIYLIKSADKNRELFRALKLKSTPLTDSAEEEYSPLPSPDGKRIAYLSGRGNLMMMNVDGSGKKKLVDNFYEITFDWSPDSRWIAYSSNDIEFNEDVWIIDAEGKNKPYNVSSHPDSDIQPAFSADGGKLAFLSRRNHDNYDLYFVYLQKDSDELSDYQRRWQENDNKDQKDKKDKPTRIDFDNLYNRIRRVTSLAADVTSFAVSPDGETFVFAADLDGDNDLYSISWEGKEMKRLTNGGHSPSAIRFSADGKLIYYMKKGGVPTSIDPSGKDAKTLPLAASIDIDIPAERKSVFLEAWRTLNDNFYDPDFHGADWTAMRDKYLPAILDPGQHRNDFNDVIGLMLGELNASHLGISSPGGSGPKSVPVGALGIRQDESYGGNGIRVEYVFKDGPADRDESRIAPGEVITSIDGHELASGDNLYGFLYEKIDRRMMLKVASADGKTSREVVIRPVSAAEESNLVYRDWVRVKRALVDSLSGGRLGYVHIEAMSWPNFEQFERELYSECHDKDALIVDVRNNPGGWINDYLLAVLTVRRHAYTVPRGTKEKGYPQPRLPLYNWVKPAATLCNGLSFSNAEIFSHAFKTLGLGPLIGETTGGAVISTGATALIDGSVFRVPFRGWYVGGSGIDMENNGAVPDIIVPEPPGEEGSGRDSQLERAVQELMKSIPE